MKMNILYIHTHDSGKVFRPYGYDVPTPAIDEFSKEATLFENAFCASPTCSPSRSSLLTGNYPHSNGMLGLTNRGFELNDYNTHLVRILNNNGYETVLCGIQHEYGRYTEHQIGAKKIGYRKDITTSVSNLKESEYYKWDANNTLAFIEWINSRKKDDKPFFASLGYFQTHREYPETISDFDNEFIPDFLEKNEIIKDDFKGHIKALKNVDENFKKVMCCLKENEIYNNTVIIFTTDHGIPYPRCKCTLFDAGIGVALIMRVPDRGIGKRVSGLVSQIDILPTLISLCELKTELKFAGIDISNLFFGDEIKRNVFSEINCHTSYEPARSIRNERYKFIKYYDETFKKENISNIDNSISKDYYLRTRSSFDKDMEQFYDLENDPFEKNNLINDETYANIINKMKEELLLWQVYTKDYLTRGNLVFKKNWKINTSECTNPKSKNDCDFIKI